MQASVPKLFAVLIAKRAYKCQSIERSLDYPRGWCVSAGTVPFPHYMPALCVADGANGALYPHIASTDVHIDDENQRLVMYVHGRDAGRQLTWVALSIPGYLYRSRDGLSDFEAGPRFFNDNMRHSRLPIIVKSYSR